jgi:hypothetical protein
MLHRFAIIDGILTHGAPFSQRSTDCLEVIAAKTRNSRSSADSPIFVRHIFSRKRTDRRRFFMLVEGRNSRAPALFVAVREVENGVGGWASPGALFD